MDLDVFVREQNITRYQRLLNSSTGSAERQTIFKLLAEEMSKLKSTPHETAGKRSAETVPGRPADTTHFVSSP